MESQGAGNSVGGSRISSIQSSMSSQRRQANVPLRVPSSSEIVVREARDVGTDSLRGELCLALLPRPRRVDVAAVPQPNGQRLVELHATLLDRDGEADEVVSLGLPHLDGVAVEWIAGDVVG